MKTYSVLRSFHFGALRASLEQGDLVEWDGKIARSGRNEAPASGLENLEAAGYLKLESETALPLPAPKAKPVPASANPDKPHKWTSEFGSGEQTCKVCGVTLENPMSVNVSKASLKFAYRDAYGIRIESLTELPCPLFVGDLGGGIASNVYRTRKLTGRVESIDERLTRLETENTELRERSDRRQEVALDLLARLTSAAERLAELGDITAPKLLPDHADIIDALVLDEPERERVRVHPLQEGDES